MKKIDKEMIKNARHLAGLSQEQAARILNKHMITWLRWENGQSTMNPIFFEYFAMKTGIIDKIHEL